MLSRQAEEIAAGALLRKVFQLVEEVSYEALKKKKLESAKETDRVRLKRPAAKPAEA